MTEDEIVHDWFMKRENRDQILTIVYSPEIYWFLVGSCTSLQIGNETFYKINNDWLKLRLRSNQPE